ncbi:MAG TPA: hypothetical protein PK566_00250 [Pseudobacteroides sp.]|nr:hypothetical protein [Pseudobacteroides sp.]
MAETIMWRNKEYTMEEFMALPEKTRKQMVKEKEAEMNGRTTPDINNMDDEELAAHVPAMEEDGEVPETELHDIKNPKAAVMLERLVASGKSTIEALELVKNQFPDLDGEPEDDKEYNKLKEELDSLEGIPPQQKAKIIGYALAHGMSAQEAATKVQVNLTRYAASRGTVPAQETPEMIRQKAMEAQDKRLGIGEYRKKLEKRRW